MAPITTIAFELTDRYAEELNKEQDTFEESRALALDHLESSYNFRRYDENKIITSILSNSNDCIPVMTKCIVTKFNVLVW